MFTKKGMVNKQGNHNLQHPHFQRMRMRSKKARLGSGGIPCVSCDKIFNCDKTMEHHRKNSTDILFCQHIMKYKIHANFYFVQINLHQITDCILFYVNESSSIMSSRFHRDF